MQRPRFLMCAPPHFGVHYVINPWMEGQMNNTCGQSASRQWNGLYETLSRFGAVELLPPVAGLPDLVFTANAALIFEGAAILSSFRHPERQLEEEHFERWLAADGFRMHTLPREIYFEGAGDALLDRGRPLLWFGCGMRSSTRAEPYLASLLDLEIQPLRLRDSRFYHLDTCFCPLESGLLLYYPGAFEPQSIHAIESRIPAEQRFAVSEQDAVDFACNAVNVGSVVILNRASPELRSWLQRHGMDVVECPMSEFLKAGGSSKCLSLRLDETYAGVPAFFPTF